MLNFYKHTLMHSKYFYIFFEIILCLLFLKGKTVTSADPFESLGVRLQCYPTEQPGCNVDFIEAYPELSKSHDNGTYATTHFYLFTLKNPDVPELLHKCAGTTPPNSQFDVKYRTEIVVPGQFSGICNFAIYRELKNELLKRGDRNVILIDWMWGNSGDPTEGSENLKIVAHQTAIVINNLKKKYGLDEQGFILTGHSVGAHLCGIIGSLTHISIINGLDPAGAVFSEETPLTDRLDRGDADCVQVIHSNAGQCLPRYLGINITCGTIDIWANGGLHQKGCLNHAVQSFLKLDYIYGILELIPPACSHFRALELYKLSANTDDCQFIGVKCRNKSRYQRSHRRSCKKGGSNCVKMGMDACDCLSAKQKSSLGPQNYCLGTDDLCPYCNNSNIPIGGFSCEL